ncbi:C40 family peptidase [Romboutsia sp. 1001285H_161024_C4]|uniref:C40 family peptidase n=1 Tax=Romboutsia sp. 1001285H_161024_C4 TaxID=2787109 RepID=UPI001897BDEC|nr:NlpC/P60 family protein [Romboutsia sp. 1001285H_161024_C4]
MISEEVKILITNRTNDTTDITNLVTKIVWSGDYKQAARTLEFDILGTNLDTNLREIRICEGFSVQFFEKGKELFRGWVYGQTRNSSSNTITYTAFDWGTKLIDIKDAFNFKNQTPELIAKTIFNKYNLEIGNIAATGVNYSKIFIDVSLYDIIMSAYTHANASNNKNYMLITRGSKFYVEEKGKITLKLSFEESKNITSNSYSSSITNMVNKVIVVDENGNRQSIVENKNDQSLYGLFQRVVQVQEGRNTQLEAKKLLSGIEQTASLSGFGDSTCITGTAVTVKDGYTGMTGLFYIDGDRHTWEDFKHTVDLNLSFKNIMNEVNAGQDEQSSTDKGSSYATSGTAILNGKEVKALFTAYYPANNSLQGGFYDAQGNRLDPSKRTCAAPKSVPFGTKIQIQGTGTSKDGQTYTVTDRGGAIKVRDGVYQFDLLMSSKNEAYSWGRKNGRAIIGDGTGYKNNDYSSSSSGSMTTKQRDVVTLAESKVGKKYVWGATGPNSFDCSGLTSWCYKQLGITIPRTSSQQSTYGKSVSKSNLQPGDLLFFSTNGTGRVSHVGMYIGGGKMVHAANPSKGVRYDDINSSYYSKTYTNARRVL